jgi:hypothetical protein
MHAAKRDFFTFSICPAWRKMIARLALEVVQMFEIAVYCPRCAERIKCKAVALAFDEVVTCLSCAAKVKASQLLTDEGTNLLDYLALQSVKAANKIPPAA